MQRSETIEFPIDFRGITKNIKVSVAIITPEYSSELLKKNDMNRRVNSKKVAEIASDMQNNNFMFNGASIVIADDGTLIDSQHRNLASIKSDECFPAIIVEGVPKDVVNTIDSGRARTYSDRLRIRGYADASHLAATVGMMALIARRQPKNAGLSASELNGILDTHGGIVETCAHVKNVFKGVNSVLSAIHYIGNKTGWEERTEAFIQVWRDGQMQYENDAVVYIREMLHNDGSKPAGSKMTTVQRQKLVMLSWHKFKNFVPIKMARLPVDIWGMSGWTPDTAGMYATQEVIPIDESLE